MTMSSRQVAQTCRS